MQNKRHLTWYVLARIRFILNTYRRGITAADKGGKIGQASGIYGEGNVSLLTNFLLGDYSSILCKGNLKIGKNFCMNDFSRLVIHGNCEIGDNVVIANNVAILDHDHDYAFEGGILKLSGYKTADIKIGNNIWVGDKATILKGVNICNNVVIGASSLVIGDISKPGVYVGIPVKLIKEF